MFLRTLSNTKATKVGNVRPGTKIHVQVLNGAGAIVACLGDRQDILENPEPFAGQSGMQFTSNDGVVEIVWQSTEVWAMGVAANASNPVINFDGGQYG